MKKFLKVMGRESKWQRRRGLVKQLDWKLIIFRLMSPLSFPFLVSCEKMKISLVSTNGIIFW